MAIELVSHDPVWHEQYRKAAAEIRGALGSTARGVHHVGSTAIPGIVAKPVIDILVLVRCYDPESLYRPPLGSVGFAFDHRDDSHVFFEGSRDGAAFHVHVVEQDADDARAMIAFRDYLRAHPEQARRYEELEIKLPNDTRAPTATPMRRRRSSMGSSAWRADLRCQARAGRRLRVVEEVARFFEFERRLLERVSTRFEAFEFGVAYLDEGCPERYHSSFLLVDTGLDDATAAEVAESAERILGGADLRHRLVVVNDDRVAERLAPAFATLGYTPSWNAIMSHQRGPDRDGDVAVDEVPFAEVRPLIREMYRQDPDTSDELADRFTEQQGKKERTIGARFFVGNVDGRRAGNCELYVHGLDAQVENVGTLEEFRGRGVARSVVLRAVEAARESGAQHTFIVADDDDWPRDLYRRLGFEQIGRTGQFLLAPTAAPVPAPR